MKNISKTGASDESANRCARNSGRGKTGNGRLSKALLHDLRNKIPIRGLIENELGVRCHTESGIFRFECPKCGSFRTSVMKCQNLARCFGCETNFNPIDMVIAVKNAEFRPSANFLAKLLESGMPAKPAVPEKRAPSDLASLSSVFSTMADPPPNGETAERRVRCLEKEVAELKNRTDRLLRVVGAILAQRGDAREIFAKIDG